eukprot:m.228882 g.228882  ORF g.228882 m.228882 type:complete len:1770 (+) comp26430_c0_seq2:104-5413(+)
MTKGVVVVFLVFLLCARPGLLLGTDTDTGSKKKKDTKSPTDSNLPEEDDLPPDGYEAFHGSLATTTATGMFPSITAVAKCQQLCSLYANCRAFAVAAAVSGAADKECSISESAPLRSSTTFSMVYSKTQLMPTSCSSIASNALSLFRRTTSEKNDAPFTWTQASPRECAVRCLSTPDCTSFDVGKVGSEKNQCFIRSTSELIPEPGPISPPVTRDSYTLTSTTSVPRATTIMSQFRLYSNMKISLRQSATTADLQACLRACLLKSSCIGITFKYPNTCYTSTSALVVEFSEGYDAFFLLGSNSASSFTHALKADFYENSALSAWTSMPDVSQLCPALSAYVYGSTQWDQKLDWDMLDMGRTSTTPLIPWTLVTQNQFTVVFSGYIYVKPDQFNRNIQVTITTQTTDGVVLSIAGKQVINSPSHTGLKTISSDVWFKSFGYYEIQMQFFRRSTTSNPIFRVLDAQKADTNGADLDFYPELGSFSSALTGSSITVFCVGTATSSCSCPAWQKRELPSGSCVNICDEKNFLDVEQRTCETVTSCNPEVQYIETDPTPTSDRKCGTLTVCTQQQYQTKPPTTSANRECSPLTTCDFSTEYISTKATDTSDRQCSAINICTDREEEQTPPSTTSDRVCKCKSGFYRLATGLCAEVSGCPAAYYESKPSSPTSDRECLPWTKCERTEYESEPPSEFKNRKCAPYTLCTGDEYESTAPSPTSDKKCSSITACTSSQYQTSPPTRTSNRQCKALATCKLPLRYEKTPPTKTSNRQCAPVTTCEQKKYQTLAPTPTSDRQCALLTVCTQQEYIEVASTPTSDRKCVTISDCSDKEYQTVAPSRTSDRRCATLRTCTQLEYQSKAPTYTSDRQCLTLKVCEKNTQFESVAATATSNRQCTRLRVCEDNEFESVAPTSTSNRICQTITSCNDNEYRESAATENADAVCVTLSPRCGDNHFEFKAPTSTSDRECRQLKQCQYPKQFEKTKPTYSTNRDCASVSPECELPGEFESTAPSPTNNRVCSTQRVCVPEEEYETKAATGTSIRECTQLEQCVAGSTFEMVAPTPTSNRVCGTVTQCVLLTNFEVDVPTLTSDRRCQDVKVCLANEFESTAPTIKSDRQCQALQACSLNATYQTTAPTATSNRLCTAVTECVQGSTFQVAAPTLEQDRQCESVKVCLVAEEFETKPPTLTSDRECQQATAPCDVVNFYEQTPLTPSADRICITRTVCNPSTEWELSAGGPSQDRTCRRIRLCQSNEYELTPPTTTSNRVCATSRICQPFEYETKAPTVTSDRQCANITTCVAGQFEKSAPTTTSDRLCQMLTECVPSSEYEFALPTTTSDRECRSSVTATFSFPGDFSVLKDVGAFTEIILNQMLNLLKVERRFVSYVLVTEGSIVVSAGLPSPTAAEALAEAVRTGSFQVVYDGELFTANSNSFESEAVQATPADDSSSDNTPIIIGVVLGVLLVIAVVLAVIIYRRRNASSNLPKSAQPSSLVVNPQAITAWEMQGIPPGTEPVYNEADVNASFNRRYQRNSLATAAALYSIPAEPVTGKGGNESGTNPNLAMLYSKPQKNKTDERVLDLYSKPSKKAAGKPQRQPNVMDLYSQPNKADGHNPVANDNLYSALDQDPNTACHDNTAMYSVVDNPDTSAAPVTGQSVYNHLNTERRVTRRVLDNAPVRHLDVITVPDSYNHLNEGPNHQRTATVRRPDDLVYSSLEHGPSSSSSAVQIPGSYDTVGAPPPARINEDSTQYASIDTAHEFRTEQGMVFAIPTYESTF